MTDAFTTQKPMCTWVVEKTDEDTGDDLSYVCCRPAVTIFSIRNPKRGPREVKTLRYPRCRMHDTQAARDRAGLDGMDIEEVP